MSKSESKLRVTDQSPLKWAEGWSRLLIGDRKEMKAWKKPFAYYKEALIQQMTRLGAEEVVISFNTGDDARRDPGVTVYFSKPLKEDFAWQMGLGIDNPAPTLAEIDNAYRKKAGDYHPDRHPDDPTKLEIFKKLGQYRQQARAWVTNRQRTDHEYALPCDRFTEPRWNLNALRLGIAALRRLEEYGLPGMLERTFRGFRVALTAHVSEEKDGTAVSA